MANEISFSGSLGFAKGVIAAKLSGTGKATQVGADYLQASQDVGTAEETLVKGDIGTIGWVAVRNMDETNFVEIGAVTLEIAIKLGPGQFFCAPWSTVNVYAKANTATCKVEYLLIEL